MREIFDFCGEITNIRLSNKKFCHIRFSEESAVDEALTLSGKSIIKRNMDHILDLELQMFLLHAFPGYRIRLGSSSDTPNTGRLHVDFANARDDQYEWECKQRQAQREQRHRERILRDNCREVSPSNPNHYTESEANSVLEKLKGSNYSRGVAIS